MSRQKRLQYENFHRLITFLSNKCEIKFVIPIYLHILNFVIYLINLLPIKIQKTTTKQPDSSSEREPPPSLPNPRDEHQGEEEQTKATDEHSHRNDKPTKEEETGN